MRGGVLVFVLATIGFVGVRLQHANEVERVSGGGFVKEKMPSGKVPESCPVTKEPVQLFVPPTPYPNDASERGGFWVGTNKLWIGLRRDGTWKGLPQWPDGSFRQKLMWWHEGYDARRDPRPKLKVTGKRLDASVAEMQSEVSNGWTEGAKHAFITNGINVSSLGCWQITGRYEDAEVSFVVWVE